MDAGEYLTLAEAAAVLKLGPETVRRWLNSGRLHGTLLSRKGGWRIPKSELLRVLSGGAAGGRAGIDGR